VEKNLNKYGRNMLLIRDGQIYLGPRPFPLEGDPKDLTVPSGLLRSSATGHSAQDPTAPDLSGGSARPHFIAHPQGQGGRQAGRLWCGFDPSPETIRRPQPGLGAALAGAVMGPILPDLGADSATTPKVLAVSSVNTGSGSRPAL